MFDLYQCSRCLSLPSPIMITKSVIHESSRGITIAANCSNNYLLIYHMIESHELIENKNRHPKDDVIIRQLMIDDRKGTIKSMVFDDTGSWLLTVTENGYIFLIPIAKVISSIEESLLDCDAIIIESCSLRSPTAIVWWKCLMDQSEIAIVGNAFGEISFIDIKTKREIGGTYVHQSIVELSIIKDKYSIVLLITCKNASQWRLTLEETRTKGKSRHDNNCDFNNTHEQSYFTCFITNNDEKEIGPNNCWNTKPQIIELIDESLSHDSQSDNSQSFTTLLHQSPFIISVTEYQGLDLGQTIVRLMPCNDFTYDFKSFISKYIIPKTSSLPITNVILTDRTLLMCTPKKCSIISREFSDSRKLAKLNSVIQEFDFDSESVASVFKMRKRDNDGLLDSFMIVTNQSIFKCNPQKSCQHLFNSIVNAITLSSPSLSCASASSSITTETAASIKGQRFAAMFGLNVHVLYEKSADLCLENRQFASALRFYHLSKIPQLKRISNLVSYGYIEEVTAYVQMLFSSKSSEIEDEDKAHFANIAIHCLVQDLLKKRLNNKHHAIERTLKVFLKENPFYDENVVIRLFIEQQLYDFAEFCAKLRVQNALLLSYILQFHYHCAKAMGEQMHELIMRSDYRDALQKSFKCQSFLNIITSKDITYSLILRKDLIAKYLRFIVKQLPNFEMPFLVRIATIFDPRRAMTQLLLNRVLAQFKHVYLCNEEAEEQLVQKKDILNLFMFVTLMIMRQNDTVDTFDEKFITIEPFLKDDYQINKRMMIETVDIACGQHHSAFIRNGCVYVWGKSQFGCVGLSNDEKFQAQEIVSVPTCIEFFKNTMAISVKSLSCGAHHTLVLTDFGVYSFGSSRYGQLGIGHEVVLSRYPILINELIDKDICKINCGQYHSLVITTDGQLYTWGWGLHGQLGHGNIENVYIPQRVDALKDLKVVSACGGYGHTVVLDLNGDVYTFGNGLFGQLGLGTNCKHSLPQKVTLTEPIKIISSKYFHTLALSANGCNLYIWGSNPQAIRIQAQCLKKSRFNYDPSKSLIKQNQDHLTPVIVDISNINGEIAKMSAGNMHSILLTVNGEVYSFGRGIDGQLGHGKVKEMKIPTMIVTLNDKIIIDIATGSDYSLAVDADGCLWGWGQNNECQIGPNNINNDSSPNIDEKSKKITIRTSKRLITFVPGGKCIELLPIRIVIPDSDESYCDSLNYSFDINTMKASTRYARLNKVKSFHDLSHVFDMQILSSVLVSYHNELDLSSVLHRFLSFRCLQMAAFVCELQKEYAKALEHQMKALISSQQYTTDKEVTTLSSKILCTFAPKVMQNVEEGVKLIEAFIQIWFHNEFDCNTLETLLTDCYKSSINDCMFGIILFNFLNDNKSVKQRFTTYFLLEMVQFTIKSMSKSPQHLFLCQSAIERITSDFESVSYPTEKLWQNILSHINCSTVGDDTAIEIIPLEEEMIVFTCKHYYGSNHFRLTVLPDFERDINEIAEIASQSELFHFRKLFNDLSKDSWDSECPKCVINDFRLKYLSN